MIVKKYSFALLGLLLFCSFSCGSSIKTERKEHGGNANYSTLSPADNFMILDSKDIAYVKGHLSDVQNILKKGAKNINFHPSPLADLSPDPHYNASGINHSGNDGKSLTRDFRMAYALALCYLITDNQAYAVTVHRIIDAWSGTLRTVGTRQGKDNLNVNAPYLIMAAKWTTGSQDHWKDTAFKDFLKTVFLPNSLRGNALNHGLWAVYMEACIGAYLNDAQLMRSSEKRWTEILKGEVSADGSMPMEMERSGTSNWRGGPDKGKKGIAYTHYALLPATLAAQIYAKYYGDSVWQSEGAKLLEKAFHRVALWSLHPETFPYYQSNNGVLAGVTTYAYFPILLKHYPDSNAEAALKTHIPTKDQFYLYNLIH